MPVVSQKRLEEGQLAVRHVRYCIRAGRVILWLSLEREGGTSWRK